MMYKFASIQGKSTTASGNLNNFSDGGEVSSYAKTAMQWAIGKKILSGDNGSLKPKSSCTRAELASIIKKYSSI